MPPCIAFRRGIAVKRAAGDIFGDFRDFVVSRGLIGPGERLLLSLSAGKDSMALLHLVLRLRAVMEFDAAVFHLNHCTRGAESDGDEEFVRAAAASAGLPAFIERFDFSRLPPGRSFEEYAREKRYRLLAQIASKHGFTAIATAHTASDNAETILMRLLRGTGVHGLAGMGARRDGIVRPIIFLSSGGVLKYLREEGIAWREDGSNLDTSFTRNFIRSELLPRATERFPEAESAIVRLGNAARETVSLLGDLLREKHGELYRMRGDEALIEYGRFKGDSRALRFVIGRAVCERFGGYVGSKMFDQVEKGIDARRAHMLLYRNKSIAIRKTIDSGQGVIAIGRTGQGAEGVEGQWERRIELAELNEKGKEMLYIEGPGLRFRLRFVEYVYFFENRTRPDCVFIAVPDELHYIIMRNRRRGDRIRLHGGEKKLKELFIDLRMERRAKELVPLLCVQGRIAAVMGGLVSEGGNRIADDFMVHPGDKKILAISRLDS